MAAKHVKSEREERMVFDIYQLDPSFYKKIISRSGSMRFTHQNSLKNGCGKVPFLWEIQPGTPKNVPNVEIVQPIRFPPAIYSLTMPRPSIPPTGPKAFLLKNLKKIKNIKNLQIRKIKNTRENPKNPKVFFFKKVANFSFGKKKKSDSVETNNTCDSDDALEFSYFDLDDFSPSPSPTSASSDSSPSPFSSFKSPKLLFFRSLQKGLLKWGFIKRSN